MNGKKFSKIIIGTGLILLVPLIAMMFSDEVRWNWFDFAIIGLLLTSAGVLYELLANWLAAKYRPVAAVIVIIIVFLIWAELSVGIFGSPFAGS